MKAASRGAALALRADIAAGWIGALVVVATLNKLLSGNATGPKGTQLGNVGWVGDDGKVHQFNALRLAGFERGHQRSLDEVGDLERARAAARLQNHARA